MTNQPKTYTLFTIKERYPFIEEMMKDKVKYISEKKSEITDTIIVRFEITIENEVDLIDLFHSGCRAGQSMQMEMQKKFIN